jgi:hypothetical protein
MNQLASAGLLNLRSLYYAITSITGRPRTFPLRIVELLATTSSRPTVVVIDCSFWRLTTVDRRSHAARRFDGDACTDRMHATKRRRTLAAGRIPVLTGLALLWHLYGYGEFLYQVGI